MCSFPTELCPWMHCQEELSWLPCAVGETKLSGVEGLMCARLDAVFFALEVVCWCAVSLVRVSYFFERKPDGLCQSRGIFVLVFSS